jgi:Bifunctional DNA primase/polymerase, N-terminal
VTSHVATKSELQAVEAAEQVPEPAPAGAPQQQPEATPLQRGKFAQIAEPLVKMNVPVTPVRPGTKRAFLPNFPATATTDLDQIYLWDQQFPGHNAACVARPVVGEVFFWEVDAPEVLTRIQKDTGHDVLAEINTFRVRSRPGRGHFYFRHTEATLSLPNLSQTYVIGQDWSLRANREYVVAPGSIHPDTGEPYTALNWGTPIAEAPQWLIDWLLTQKVQKTEGKKDEAIRGAAGLIPHGSIHGWMLTQAGKLRQMGLGEESIRNALRDLVDKNCEPPIDWAKVDAMAKSICIYEPGDPRLGPILLNNSGTVEATVNEPTDKFHFTDVNLKPEAGSTLLVFDSQADANIASRLGFNSTAVLPGEGSTSVSATVTAIKLAYERLVLFGDGDAIKALKPLVTPGSILGEFPSGQDSLDDLLADDGVLRDHLNKQLKRPELQRTSVMLDEGVYRARAQGILMTASNELITPNFEGHLLDPRLVVASASDNLKNLMVKHSSHPKPLTSVSLHGILGDYVELCYPTTAACRELLHAAITPVLGAMFGKMMPCYFGSDAHPGADFFLIIARTADGKGQAIGHALTAARLIDREWAGTDYYSQAASGEGLTRMLASGNTLTVQGKRCGLVIPEMTACLTGQARDGSTLGEKIREAWDGLKLDNIRSEVKKSVSAQNYVLGVCGAITPQALDLALPAIDWRNGSVNRFNWCVPSESRPTVRSQGKPNFDAWVKRVQTLYYLNMGLKEEVEIKYSEAGGKLWDEWVAALPVYDDEDLMADGMARTKPHAFRLANLYAQLDERRLDGWKPCLEPVHVAAGIEIVERSRESMQWHLNRGKFKGSGVVDKADVLELRQMLAKKLAEGGEARLTGSELHKAFSHLTEEQRNMLCLEAGLVAKRHGGTGGRPAMVWEMRGS